ncbi:MAG: carbohydrate ABC transporter permease [Halanaerobiaceae bacterium]
MKKNNKTIDNNLINRFRNIKFNKKLLIHIFITGLGFLMIYPLLWMLSSSFKPSTEIFASESFFPQIFTLENYIIGWKGISGYTFTRFFTNSFFVTFMVVLGTLISSSMAAFAFSKLDFPLKKLFFAIMLGTLMLPYHVRLIPTYIVFNKLDWINTFLPLYVPRFFATHAFFVFLLVQYMRTIPNEIMESAKIDGSSMIGIYLRLMMPLSVPALITSGILTFIWTWNDFFSQLLYLSDVTKFTVAIALRMFIDATSGSSWGAMFAMSVLSLVPLFAIFVFFQKYIVEGITSGSVKG